MSGSTQAAEIRERMASLRSELDEGVDDIFEDARTLGNWRYYVHQYPWACLAAAATAGFLLVPRRLELVTPDAETLLRLAKKNQIVIKQKPEPRPKGPGGALISFLANMAMRSALAYAGQQMGKWSSGQAEAQPAETGSNGAR